MSIEAGLARRVLAAGWRYFLVVFACGFVLGLIRVPLLEPRFGVRWAELVEMPVMLLAIILAGRWIRKRMDVPPRILPLLAVGLVALILLLLTEFSVVLWLRGMTLADYIDGRDPVSGSVYGVMLLIFSAMPLLLSMNRKRGKQK